MRLFTLRSLMLLVLITAIVGVTVGTWLSTRVGSRPDRLVSYLAAVSFAMPGWWVGILLILVTVSLLSNLMVDISYSWLDPRIRYGDVRSSRQGQGARGKG